MTTEYNILIVDDSAITRALIKRVIGMTGIPVLHLHEASGGTAALATMESNADSAPIHLVLTDLNMPGMDGAELTRRIRANNNFNAVPIIVISAQPDETCVSRELRLHVQGWLPKPFTPESVRDMIENVLNIHAQAGA